MKLTEFFFLMSVVLLLAVVCGGCISYTWSKVDVEIPDRSLPPPVSAQTICGYGATGKTTNSGAPDMRYGCR